MNIFLFFNSSKLILSNTINPPLDSDSIHQLGKVIQETYEESISLDNVLIKKVFVELLPRLFCQYFR